MGVLPGLPQEPFILTSFASLERSEWQAKVGKRRHGRTSLHAPVAY